MRIQVHKSYDEIREKLSIHVSRKADQEQFITSLCSRADGVARRARQGATSIEKRVSVSGLQDIIQQASVTSEIASVSASNAETAIR